MSANGSRASRTARRWGARLGRVRFGDSTGLALFLTALLFFGVTWRVDVFMTDSAAFVNGLGALGDGHFVIDRAHIGSGLDVPGIYDGADGPVARNYGQLVLSLPILLFLRAISMVANLHVAVVALWHLVLLVWVVHLGQLVQRARIASLVGSGTVLVLFVANLSTVRRLPDFAPVVLSLQLLTLLAAALAVVVCYRLLADIHGRRIGLFAGAALAVATPVAFWSSLPKRHVFTGLAVLLIVFAVHRSRTTGSGTIGPAGTAGSLLPRSTAYRGLAYATVGLYAWVHAAEALFMLVGLAFVDLPTAPRRDARSIGVVAIALALSLLPMFLTNVLVAGDPLTPPRLLADFSGSLSGGQGGGAAAGGGSQLVGGSGGGATTTGFLDVAGHLSELTITGATTLTTDVDRLVQTYVWNRPDRIGEMGGQARYAGANLTVLESMPLATGVFAGLALVVGRLRSGIGGLLARFDAADAVAVVFASTFAILYADRLPLHAQFTQRYLFPLYPLAIYGLCRLPTVRRVVTDHWRPLVWSYAGGLFVGGQLLFTYVRLQDLAVGEAFQFHGVLNLALGSLLLLALSGAAIRPRLDRTVAVLLGLTAAGTTIFVLLSGLVYFPIGRHALPLVDLFSELLAAA